MSQQVSSPLTLVMKIKSPTDAAALALMLKKFAEMGRENPIRLAMDKVGTVHFARFVFLNENTDLAIITSYDGDFEQYLTAFTQYLGDIFDELFEHIANGPPLPVAENPAAFSAYVAKNNASPPGTLYSAYPLATVKTILTWQAQNS